jgi:pimeloyl-ACP methyl ester carboxylesterase
MKKAFKIIGIILLALVGIYFVGPRPTYPAPTLDTIKPAFDLSNVEAFVKNREAQVALRPDNEARVIYADSVRQTEYSVVYLHGFSATQEEGNPLHRNFAKRYGCNLYLSRMPKHGETNPDAFEQMTPTLFMDGAKEAIAIGKVLGKKVILIGCSTGATAALFLAKNDPDIAALMLYSPNIDIANPAADLLTGPWGQEIAEVVSGGKYHVWTGDPGVEDYWSTSYRIEGLSAVQALVEETMKPEVFKAVTQPVFMGYYYKDEEHQDEVVSVAAMHPFFEQLGTPAHLKRKVAFPNAAAHVICGRLATKDLATVEAESYKYAEEVLGLKVNGKW